MLSPDLHYALPRSSPAAGFQNKCAKFMPISGLPAVLRRASTQKPLPCANARSPSRENSDMRPWRVAPRQTWATRTYAQGNGKMLLRPWNMPGLAWNGRHPWKMTLNSVVNFWRTLLTLTRLEANEYSIVHSSFCPCPLASCFKIVVGLLTRCCCLSCIYSWLHISCCHFVPITGARQL